MLFTEEQIEKLVSNLFPDEDGNTDHVRHDAFDLVEQAGGRVVVYLFDREDNIEVRIVRHYLDHFNMIVEEIILEQFFVPKFMGSEGLTKWGLKWTLIEALNEQALINGGFTK